MKKATAKIVLDTRREKDSGTYPVKLLLYHNRDRKYFPTKYDLTEEDFKKVSGDKPRGVFKEISLELEAVETKANHIIDEMKFFSFQLFERNMFQLVKGGGSLNDFFDAIIKELEENGQIKTASVYKSSRTSLSKFKTKIDFEEITPSFLEKYEKWMLSNDNSRTTIGMYLRAVRLIFNRAISENKIARELYPFGRGKYVIPTGNNIKKALSLDQIEQVFKAKLVPRSTPDRARDFWCFSYLCNGINMADIARLKYKHLYDNELHVERKKTARANKGKNETIIIPLLPKAQKIISKWGNRNISPETYIFPILKRGFSPVEEIKTVEQFIKTINKFNKRLGLTLGLDFPLTTYPARHSFSTVLKRHGASLSQISEALGHRNEKTTRNYLASFDTETRVKNAQALTAFRRKKRSPEAIPA